MVQTALVEPDNGKNLAFLPGAGLSSICSMVRHFMLITPSMIKGKSRNRKYER